MSKPPVRPFPLIVATTLLVLLLVLSALASTIDTAGPLPIPQSSPAPVPIEDSGPSPVPMPQGTRSNCVYVSKLTSPLHRVSGRSPVLPASMAAIKTVSGALLYEVVVGETGSVTDAYLLRLPHSTEPWPQLAEAWRTAILGWRYTPPRIDGSPVAVCLTVVVGVEVRE